MICSRRALPIVESSLAAWSTFLLSEILHVFMDNSINQNCLCLYLDSLMDIQKIEEISGNFSCKTCHIGKRGAQILNF